MDAGSQAVRNFQQSRLFCCVVCTMFVYLGSIYWREHFMKNIVAMLLAMSVVSGTAVLAAEAGKETTTTTETTVKKPGVKHRHRKTVVHHKTDVKTGNNKTTTENSTKTESTQK